MTEEQLVDKKEEEDKALLQNIKREFKYHKGQHKYWKKRAEYWRMKYYTKGE